MTSTFLTHCFGRSALIIASGRLRGGRSFFVSVAVLVAWLGSSSPDVCGSAPINGSVRPLLGCSLTGFSPHCFSL